MIVLSAALARWRVSYSCRRPYKLYTPSVIGAVMNGNERSDDVCSRVDRTAASLLSAILSPASDGRTLSMFPGCPKTPEDPGRQRRRCPAAQGVRGADIDRVFHNSVRYRLQTQRSGRSDTDRQRLAAVLATKTASMAPTDGTFSGTYLPMVLTYQWYLQWYTESCL